VNFELAELLAPLNLITFVAFVVIAGLFLMMGLGLRRLRYDPIRERLDAFRDEPVDDTVFGQGLTEALAGQIPLTRLDNGMLDRELRRAGYYRPTAKSEFLALRNALIILVVILTGMIVVGIGPERQTLVLQVLVVGLVVALICWAVPRLYLRSAGTARVARIRHALPDAVDMITMCLTGGIALRDALAHVSREIYFAHPDLAVELLIIRQQAELTSLEAALDQFSRRVDAPEATALATLIIEGQRLGTDLADSMREFSDTMRTTRRQLADEQTSRATVKLLFPITLCLLPAAIIYLWGPAVVGLIDFLRNFEAPPPLNQ
jgi:tight adherence protein C